VADLDPGSQLPAPRERLRALLAPLGITAFTFAVYAYGSCRTIYVGDSGELVTAVHGLGIPHPTGYPLYVLLGKLWHSGKLDWSWSQGDATHATDLGDPTDDTAYHVCLYDEVSGTPAGLCVDVPPGAGWTAEENGFRFESKAGVQGIRSIQLEAGAAGQAEVAVQGKGVALPAAPQARFPRARSERSERRTKPGSPRPLDAFDPAAFDTRERSR
jgi:hypothetical protein